MRFLSTALLNFRFGTENKTFGEREIILSAWYIRRIGYADLLLFAVFFLLKRLSITLM
jgi:hypothetical protein